MLMSDYLMSDVNESDTMQIYDKANCMCCLNFCTSNMEKTQ